jgi:hypothetical protein
MVDGVLGLSPECVVTDSVEAKLSIFNRDGLACRSVWLNEACHGVLTRNAIIGSNQFRISHNQTL